MKVEISFGKKLIIFFFSLVIAWSICILGLVCFVNFSEFLAVFFIILAWPLTFFIFIKWKKMANKKLLKERNEMIAYLKNIEHRKNQIKSTDAALSDEKVEKILAMQNEYDVFGKYNYKIQDLYWKRVEAGDSPQEAFKQANEFGWQIARNKGYLEEYLKDRDRRKAKIKSSKRAITNKKVEETLAMQDEYYVASGPYTGSYWMEIEEGKSPQQAHDFIVELNRMPATAVPIDEGSYKTSSYQSIQTKTKPLIDPKLPKNTSNDELVKYEKYMHQARMSHSDGNKEMYLAKAREHLASYQAIKTAEEMSKK